MIQERIKKIQDIKHSAEVRNISSSLFNTPETRQWPEISMKTHVSLETLRRALTQLQHNLDEKLTKTELKRMQQYAGFEEGKSNGRIITKKKRNQQTRYK
ncbi:E3 ubiquitin- ligase TRIM39-like protein [Labeo rohita]|uniref:E3 ubiquitin-ligase TRIM39-like protein n=1 Tax=Labeo rohita TaxID=84645 RepID=A0A498MW19_LABRO|nr:E3 ubiquitin- ligase TRIM39-like protein [Labeo rohita]